MSAVGRVRGACYADELLCDPDHDISGSQMWMTSKHAYQLGASGYLVKPQQFEARSARF